MENRPDCHLIVRVHPRELGRGQSGYSEHARQLMAVFKTRPDNVSINLPSDNIPLYEILTEADAVLIAWSSVGMEAGMFGIPVVSYFPEALLFPPALALTPESRAGYAAALDEALASGWSMDRARSFFRWAVLALERTRLQMNGKVPADRSSRDLVTLIRRAANRLRRQLLRIDDPRWDLISRPKRPRAAEDVRLMIDRRYDAVTDLPRHTVAGDKDAETRALCDALGQLAKHFTARTGKTPRRLVKLAADCGR